MPPSRLLLVIAVAVAAFGLWLLSGHTAMTPGPRPQSNPPDAATARAADSAPAAAPTNRIERETPAAAPMPGANTPSPPPTGLSGVVKEENGTGQADILVELLDADGSTLLATTSDADGRFAFERAIPRAVAIATRPAPAGLPRLRHRMPGNNRRGEPWTTVTLWRPPAGRITGTVVDDRGQPVAGAVVDTDHPYVSFGTVGWHVLEGEPPQMTVNATTDAQGNFEIRWCKSGRHRLRAQHGSLSGTIKVDANEAGVVIRLGAHLGGAVVLSGQLTDRRTGAPIAAAEVWVHQVRTSENGGSANSVATAKTDAQGRYEVQGLDPGTYKIASTPPGFASAETKRDVTAGHHVMDLTLLPARRVRVRVVLPDGAPLQGAQVRVRDAEGATVTVPGTMGIPGDWVVSDAKGIAELRLLPAARLTLLAMRGDFTPAGRVDVDLTHGAPEEVTIQLPNAIASFARQHFFKLMDADGKPAAIDGTVVASSFDGDQLLSRVEGRWRGDTFYLGNHQQLDRKTPVMAVGAIAGACRVEIAAPGYQLLTLTLEPGAKSPTTVTLER